LTAKGFNHITYTVNSRRDVLRVANMFLENGVAVETFHSYGIPPVGNGR
jgi:hypothetical protein